MNTSILQAKLNKFHTIYRLSACWERLEKGQKIKVELYSMSSTLSPNFSQYAKVNTCSTKIQNLQNIKTKHKNNRKCL